MRHHVLAAGIQLHVNWLDYLILGGYLAMIVGIGVLSRRSVNSSLDFLLSGRALPAWITGLAFVSANLGPSEVLGNAANGAQYGLYGLHYDWIGAIPAMVFLGLVMMPFYYGSKVRSVPEFLRRRFNPQAHLLNSITFAIAQLLVAGINLYFLALILDAVLGWPIWVSVLVAAAVVFCYIVLGGLRSAVYNEVLQFFIILAALLPVLIVGLLKVGGIDGLVDRVRDTNLGPEAMHTFGNTAVGTPNTLGANWIGIVFGLGFVLSFGYWTTNFAEVQRALSANGSRAARLTPIIGAYPKLVIGLLTVVPGMIALVLIPGLGTTKDLQYNNAIPLLMGELLPNGVLGVALTGLFASFMAGTAANISGFNTVFTYDIWQTYVRRRRPDRYYLTVGRCATAGGMCIGVGSAFIAAGYGNVMNYVQSLFSMFNAPLFAVFVVGMFWKRMTPWAGFWGLLAGTVSSMATYLGYRVGLLGFGSDLSESMWGAMVAFVMAVLVAAAVTSVTRPKPVSELAGLVYGVRPAGSAGGLSGGISTDTVVGDARWYRSPVVLGIGVLVLLVAIYIPFL